MNQQQLAILVGVTQETISKAERGVLRLSKDVEQRIATALGVSRADLFDEEAQAVNQ